MIWQENISCIVMLLSNVTEGNIIRCQQYWPDTGTAYYGPYKVTIERLVENSIYKERQFALNVRQNYLIHLSVSLSLSLSFNLSIHSFNELLYPL